MLGILAGIEVALTAVGVLALMRRRLPVGRTRVVVGTPARFLGLVALTPLPLAAVSGLLLALSENPTEPRPLPNVVWLLTGIESGICLCVAVVVYGGGAALAISPEEAERRERGSRYNDDEDDYDDRRDRRDRDDRDRDDRDRDDRDRDDDRRDQRDRKPWQ